MTGLDNDQGNMQDLANYRLQKSYNLLKDAVVLIKLKSYQSADNRIYYAVFNAINAVNALYDYNTKKHTQAIGEFNKKYIHTEIFNKEYGRIINRIHNKRNVSDYDDFAAINPEETKENFYLAKKLVNEIKNFCQNKLQKEIQITLPQISKNEIDVDKSSIQDIKNFIINHK